LHIVLNLPNVGLNFHQDLNQFLLAKCAHDSLDYAPKFYLRAP
jgi:hypothetical protein